ncbi:MAG: hypothetical protein LBU88_05380 [Treponema sp.]|jgi:hypothetical protein|nr:hypothetical protein [Treponema sp.]
MKHTIKLFAVIALAALIGIAAISCPNGGHTHTGIPCTECGFAIGFTVGVNAAAAAQSHFSNFAAALGYAKDGDTIFVWEAVTHTEQISIQGKALIIELNGFTFNLNTDDTALYVQSGTFTTRGGAFNITVTGEGSYGVRAFEQGEVTTTGGSFNITATGEGSTGVSAEVNSEVTITGDITATGGVNIGVWALDNSEVIINGALQVTEVNSVYISFAAIHMEKGDGTLISGYFVYEDGNSIVKIRDDCTHSWGAWTNINPEPTCVATGTGTSVCTACGARDTNAVIPPDPNAHGEWVHRIVDPPTCVATGSGYKDCGRDRENCKYSEPFTFQIDPDNHAQGGVCTLCSNVVPFTMVSAGSQHSLGIRDGRLYAWGLADDGRLGNGATSGNVTTPVQIGTDTDWTFVSAGNSHSLGIRGGRLYAWGSAFIGKLGNGAISGDVTTPVQIGTDTDWTFVSAGVQHSLGIRAGLYAWGLANDGRLGNGATSGNVTTPTGITVP